MTVDRPKDQKASAMLFHRLLNRYDIKEQYDKIQLVHSHRGRGESLKNEQKASRLYEEVKWKVNVIYAVPGLQEQT